MRIHSRSGIGQSRPRPAKYRGRPAQRAAAAHRAAVAQRAWAAALLLRDVISRVHRPVREHRLVAIAAGVTFYGLLAIFPAIAAIVAVYGLFADPSTIARHLSGLAQVLPGGAIEVIQGQLDHVVHRRHSTLGVTFVIGVAVSLWSANAGMKALIDALNIVYGERESRGFLRLNAVSLALTSGGILLALLAIGAVIVLPLAMHEFGLSPGIGRLASLLKWPVLLVGIALTITALNAFGPSRRRPHRHWITPGSACATIVWLAVSMLFSWYTGNFGRYDRTYGSLGAVIGFMTWIWLSIIVILVGAEIDAFFERRAHRRRLHREARRRTLSQDANKS